jgi:hypothetical protein
MLRHVPDVAMSPPATPYRCTTITNCSRFCSLTNTNDSTVTPRYNRRLHLGILGAIPYDSINVLCLEYLVFATSGSLVGVVCRGGVGLPWCDPVY